MRHRTWTGLLSAALLASTAAGLRAELSHNPYAAIIPRNAFGLNSLKPEPKTPPPPAPGVDVYLTGIVTLGRAKEVLLQVVDKTPGKKPEYLPPLVEGDVQGRVEVVAIDADKGAVVIRIDGVERTLTFEKDAPKPGGATPAVLPQPLGHLLVRSAGPVLLPPPTAQPTTAPSGSGVMVGGANTPGTVGPLLPPMPTTKLSGVVDRGIPVAPPSPPRMYRPIGGARPPQSVANTVLRSQGNGCPRCSWAQAQCSRSTRLPLRLIAVRGTSCRLDSTARWWSTALPTIFPLRPEWPRRPRSKWR